MLLKKQSDSRFGNAIAGMTSFWPAVRSLTVVAQVLDMNFDNNIAGSNKAMVVMANNG